MLLSLDIIQLYPLAPYINQLHWIIDLTNISGTQYHTKYAIIANYEIVLGISHFVYTSDAEEALIVDPISNGPICRFLYFL